MPRKKSNFIKFSRKTKDHVITKQKIANLSKQLEEQFTGCVLTLWAKR